MLKLKLYSKQSQDPLTRKIRVGFDPEKPSVYYPVAAVRTWENIVPQDLLWWSKSGLTPSWREWEKKDCAYEGGFFLE